MKLVYIYDTNNINEVDIYNYDKLVEFSQYIISLRNEYSMDNVLYEYFLRKKYIECCEILCHFRRYIHNHSQARMIIKNILGFCLKHESIILKLDKNKLNRMYAYLGGMAGYYIIAFGRDANKQYDNITTNTINTLYNLYKDKRGYPEAKYILTSMAGILADLDREAPCDYNINVNDLQLVEQYYVYAYEYRNINIKRIISPYKFFNIDMSQIYALVAKLLYIQSENEPELYQKNLVIIKELIPTHMEQIFSLYMIYELGGTSNAIWPVNI